MIGVSYDAHDCRTKCLMGLEVAEWKVEVELAYIVMKKQLRIAK